MRNFLWMSALILSLKISPIWGAEGTEAVDKGNEAVEQDSNAPESAKQSEEPDENSTLIVLPQLTVPIVRHGVVFSYYILSLSAETGDPEKAIQVRQLIPSLMDALFSDLYKILALNYQIKIPKERIKIYISTTYNRILGESMAQAEVRSLNYHGIGKKKK